MSIGCIFGMLKRIEKRLKEIEERIERLEKRLVG